jgi:hypothetical protein
LPGDFIKADAFGAEFDEFVCGFVGVAHKQIEDSKI